MAKKGKDMDMLLQNIMGKPVNQEEKKTEEPETKDIEENQSKESRVEETKKPEAKAETISEDKDEVKEQESKKEQKSRGEAKKTVKPVEEDEEDEFEEETEEDEYEEEETTIKKTSNRGRKPNKADDWKHFSFICSVELADKVQAIARKEGFTVRELMEFMMRQGINAYEEKYGKIKKHKAKNINDVMF